MKAETEILNRIEELHINLRLVELRLQEELGKHFRKRDHRLLVFLDRERSVWEFALQQLQWSLSDEH